MKFDMDDKELLWHEWMDRASSAVEIFSNLCCCENHLNLDPELKKQALDLEEKLATFYQAVGTKRMELGDE